MAGEVVRLTWSTSSRRDISGRMPTKENRNFTSRKAAAIFAVESEEIADLYRHTVEMAFDGAVFFFVDIKRMYERHKSEG